MSMTRNEIPVPTLPFFCIFFIFYTGLISNYICLFHRDKKIDLHRKFESELRSKLDEQKGIEMQLNSRLAVLQNKLDLLGSNSDSDLLESYKQQNERLQTDLEKVRNELKTVRLYVNVNF